MSEFAWGLIDWLLATALVLVLAPFLGRYSVPVQISILLSLLLIAAGASRIIVDTARRRGTGERGGAAIWRVLWGAELLILSFALRSALRSLAAARYVLFLVGFCLHAHGIFIMWHRDAPARSRGLLVLAIGVVCVLLSLLLL